MLCGVYRASCLLLQEQKEIEQAEEIRRRQFEAEMERLEKEAAERETQRRIEERNEIKKKAAKEKLEQIKSTELGAKAFADIKEDVSAGQKYHISTSQREKCTIRIVTVVMCCTLKSRGNLDMYPIVWS